MPTIAIFAGFRSQFSVFLQNFRRRETHRAIARISGKLDAENNVKNCAQKARALELKTNKYCKYTQVLLSKIFYTLIKRKHIDQYL